MTPQLLHANLFVFDSRNGSEVRAEVARALNCSFDDEFSKSDEFGTTWFGDVFGFEISFKLMSRRDDGAWYVVTATPGPSSNAAQATMVNIDFHVSQILTAVGFQNVVTADEYRQKS